MNAFTRLTAVFFFSALLAACGGSTGSGSSFSDIIANGAGVKGPLVGAQVTMYRLDPERADLKGAVVALGSTDANAQLQLAVPGDAANLGPFLIEYSNGTERNGNIPAIESLQTVMTSAQLLAGTPVYATPLSSLAIAHARQIADRPDDAIDPVTVGLSGDNNGTVDQDEFMDALLSSGEQIKQSLGLGVLDEEIDLFTTPPVVEQGSDLDETIALRIANEVFAAIVENIKADAMSNGSAVSGDTLLASLAVDFSDGSFDGQADSLPVAELGAANDIADHFDVEPDQLQVPDSEYTIAEMDELLSEETQALKPELPPVELEKPQLEKPDPTLDAQPKPQPEPQPEPDPEPQPNAQSPVVAIASPGNEAQFTEGSSITVSVNASDADGSIDHCEMYVNGLPARIDDKAPFVWGVGSGHSDAVLNNLIAGNYGISAKCYDDAGNYGIDVIIVVVTAPPTPDPDPVPDPDPEPDPDPQPDPDPVPDPDPEPSNIAPVTLIQLPSGNVTLQAGDDLDVQVQATDSDGTIAHCVLRMNGQMVRQENQAPYQWGSINGVNDPQLQSLAEGEYVVQVTCTDNGNLSSSDQFAVVVEPAPVAPSVSIASISATELDAGDALAIEIGASDSDGDVAFCDLMLDGNLVRRAYDAPYEFGMGSGFDDTALQSLDAGSYTLLARCTDSDDLSATAAISISVAPEAEPELVNVSLQWGIPTAREDGSALPTSELASYEIYYYTEGGHLDNGQTVTINAVDGAGNMVNSHAINGLQPGSYFFSIATVDTAGRVSDFLAPVSITLQ